MISAYYPQANSVKRGYQAIKDGLSKLANAGKGNWLQNLHACFWADRTTVRTTTGVSPFRFNAGYEPIMPIEEEVPSWRFLAWEEVKTTAELLALRTLQLQRRDEDYEEVRLRLRRVREEGKERFDATHVLHAEPFKVGNLVLLHNTMREADMSSEQKMHFRWLGPYKIKQAIPLKGTYILEELNGEVLGGTVAGNRLKRFHSRPEEPKCAGPLARSSELLNRTISEIRSWHSESSSDETEEEGALPGIDENSTADERGERGERGKGGEGSKRKERFIGVFIPVRV